MAEPRDTQFSGFAEKLILELDIETPYTEEQQRWERIISQRSYDLVRHAVEQAHLLLTHSHTDWTAEEILAAIPDLTTWPAESQGLDH